MNLEALKKLGSEWQKNNMHRIYLNNLDKLYGLELNTYATGNISSAKLKGQKISNSKARRLKTDLDFGKLYYDVDANEYHHSGLSDTVAETIIANIEEGAA